MINFAREKVRREIVAIIDGTRSTIGHHRMALNPPHCTFKADSADGSVSLPPGASRRPATVFAPRQLCGPVTSLLSAA